MKPVPYDKVEDFQSITVKLNDGEYRGNFTSMRIDRKSLPFGYFAYDVRHDEETWLSELKTCVLVNHFGTFITHTEISNAEEGRKILSVSFENT